MLFDAGKAFSHFHIFTFSLFFACLNSQKQAEYLKFCSQKVSLEDASVHDSRSDDRRVRFGELVVGFEAVLIESYYRGQVGRVALAEKASQ
jgi:hypothetical protein